MAIVRTRLISFTADRIPMPRKIRMGIEGDNLVERLRFALPVIAEHQTATLVITGRADVVRLNYDEENGYYVDLTAEIVGPDGETEAYVRIDGNSGEAWSSNPFRLITGALPDVDEEIEQRFPGAVETMLAEIEKHRGEMQDMESRDDELSYQIRAFSPDFTVSGSAPTCKPLAGDPLTVVSQIEIRQEGSGDPSPSNVRPIVRHGQVSLTITDDEGQRVITHELATPVVRGSYNWATGEARNDVRIRDIGAATPVETGTSSTGIKYVRLIVEGAPLTTMLACNRYKVTTSLPSASGYIRIVGTVLYIYDNAIDFANPSAAYAGTEVVEPAAETVTQDTPTEVLAGKGVNTIVSSTGSTEVSGKGVLDVYSKKEVDDALDMLAGAVQEVDKTLTKAGAAADAKVVGERISELSEEIEELKTPSESVTLTENGTVISFDGCVKDAKITVSGNASDGAKMVHISKNFAPYEKSHQDGSQIVYTALENGKFKLVGKATSVHWIYFWHPTVGTTRNKLLPAGTYTIHTDLETNGDNTGGFVVRSWDTESTTGGGVYLANNVDKNNPKQFTLDKPTWCSFALTWHDASPAYDGEFYVQIERGSVATDFVKNVRNEYDASYPMTIDAFDGTNIIFDSAGTMLAATYTEGEAVGGLSVATINKIVDERTAFDPVPYGLPILRLEGSTVGMNKDNAVTLDYVYGERKGTCTVKWQGSSSLSYPKKNYTIKFDTAFEAKEGWGAQKKYCFKANYIDHSHARNICSCKLWGEIVKSRANVPTELSGLVNGGAIDGFPCIIMLNGEFHGLYTWNIPKDGWMFGVPKAIICADAHVAATQFKALATLDGDFELEYVEDENNTDWVLSSLNTAIQAVMNGNIDTAGQYIDIPSAIDYYIHTVDENANDCTDKNYILVTFDGVKWYFSAYDRDSIYGLHYAAEEITSPVGGFTFAAYADRHRLMELIHNNKSAELKARAIELREGVKSEANVATVFSNFIGSIPSQLYAEDEKTWPMLPLTSVSNLTQILNWYRLRRQVIDKEIDAM